ncbi:MAG: hypothetical protein B7Y36_13850 [Novosphingobium sp. 28-62-57]|nr:MAG: hypothetical protein B7Z34_14010 [Novosphingobium sp. 12-62-10]OYZ09256.1 MAG: hypothetical protein B7Y36_13850 [Novosphingobium sp. 28-62-57]OZA36093.1 MAG: hypothetical protein B7X92_07720 [Novosphingobium sp. 17-62-9]
MTKRKAKPITAHPLFPIVTSLWFAAFLSLGSFAVAPQLLEGPVVALGIPEILPAAQPPLGFTVRALLAMVMLGVGGLAGFFLGKALAGGKAASPVRTRSFGQAAAKTAPHRPEPSPQGEATSAKRSPHRRPLNPIEDLGQPMGMPFSGETYAPVDPQALEGLDFTADAAEKTRLPWEQAPEQTSEQDGAEPTRLMPQPRTEAQRQAELDDPLALDLLLANAEVISKANEPAREAPVSSAPLFQTSAPLADSADLKNEAAPTETERTETAPTKTGPIAAQPTPGSVPLIKTPLFQAPSLAPTPLARTPLEDLGLVQLVERLALAIGRRHSRADTRQPSAPHAFAPAEAAPEPEQTPASTDRPSGFDDAPNVGSFAVVQPQPAAAIARFGMPETSAPAAAPTAAPQAPEKVPAEPKAQDERPNETVVQLRPTALRPFTPDLEAVDEEAPEFERFLRVRNPEPSPQSLTPTFSADDFDEESEEDEEDGSWPATGAEDDVAEERYPSLLDMGAGSLRHRAQHATLPLTTDASDDSEGDEEDGFEPAVVFPGHEAQLTSPVETTPRLFERPGAAGGAQDLIIPVPGSPLAAPGRAAPSSPIDALGSSFDAQAVSFDAQPAPAIDAEEADRALRAALATLQRMTAQG